LTPLRVKPPLSSPQVDNNSGLHPHLPNSNDHHLPLPPSVVLTARLFLALEVVAAAVVVTATVAIVFETTVPLHRLPARAGVAPPEHPSTTIGLTPSTFGQARPGCLTLFSLCCGWGPCSCLLWRLYLFPELHHLSQSPGHCGLESGIHSPSPTPSAPWSSLPPPPPLIGWLTPAPPTTPSRT
jgi:hypothetical protein